MADGIQITAGSGTTVFTDDTASGHIQVMKLAVAADGSATLIGGTAQGLQVVQMATEAGAGVLTWSSSEDLDETEEEIVGSAAALHGYYFHNKGTSERTLKFYDNTAAGTTVGTTATKVKFRLPAATAGHIALPHSVTFATGLTVACTTGYADNDATAPTANDVTVAVFYYYQ